MTPPYLISGKGTTALAAGCAACPLRGHRLPSVRTGYKWLTGVLIALSLCFVALMVEASVGHDGLLCELGYGSDGDTDCG
jgi:hypothetical protein